MPAITSASASKTISKRVGVATVGSMLRDMRKSVRRVLRKRAKR